MQAILAVLGCIFLTISSVAQNDKVTGELPEREPRAQDALKDFPNTDKFTANSRILLIKLKELNRPYSDSAIQELRDLFAITKREGKYYIGAIANVSSELNTEKLMEQGIEVGFRITGFCTIDIPLSLKHFRRLAQTKGINRVQVDNPLEKNLNESRSKSNVDKVHYGRNLPQGYAGDGVIVGIVDQGFDYNHPTMYDTTWSQYRVDRIWDMAAPGTPPAGATYGNELTDTSKMKKAKTDTASVSHGAHVAGIAAGGASNNSQDYKGYAPKSDLILTGGTAGSDSKLLNGIIYTFRRADSVNKPAVVNLSWGSDLGPKDGTSFFDTACENLVGPGKILVGSAGNSGSDSIHLRENVTSSNNLYTFLKFNRGNPQTSGKAIIDIWSDKNQDFKVSVNIYSTSSNSYDRRSATYSTKSNYSSFPFTLQDGDPFFPDDCKVTLTTESSSNTFNGKGHACLVIDHTGQEEDYQFAEIQVEPINNQPVNVDAWLRSSDGGEFEALSFPNINTDGNTRKTINSLGGTGDSIISVGAYTTKTSYKNCFGNLELSASFSLTGEIAPFSSKGPTADGRIKPEITAPGNTIVSAYNSNGTNFNCNNNNNTVTSVSKSNSNKNFYFGALSGTSMAAPAVTGTIALMLEKNPTLTVREAENILTNNARQDQYTGNTSNSTWGYGKLDAYAAVKNTPCFDTIGINTISDTAICLGDSVVLKTKGGESHNWTSSGGLSCTNCQNPVAKPTGNTTYIVDGITKNGCKAGDTVQVTVNPNPAANAGSNATICKGEKATLSASGGTSYQWQPSNSLNCDTCATVKASPTINQTYKLTAINQNGCSDTDSVKVEVDSLPTATVSQDSAICKGNSIQLNASGGSSYSWTPGAGLSCTGCANPVAKPVTTRTYKVIAATQAGCKDTASVQITVESAPTVNPGTDKTICKGKSTQLKATGGDSYRWTPSESLSCDECASPTAMPPTTTKYRVVAVNIGNCTDTGFVKVEVNPTPTANAGADQTICDGDSITLNGTGGNSYKWQPSIGLSCTNCQSPKASPANTTKYTLIATNKEGCSGKDSVLVEVENCSSGLASKSDQKGFEVYPNPNDGSFTIALSKENLKNIAIRIQNLKGRTLHRSTIPSDQSEFKRELSLSNISNGIYNLQVITDDKVYNKKITIY